MRGSAFDRRGPNSGPEAGTSERSRCGRSNALANSGSCRCGTCGTRILRLTQVIAMLDVVMIALGVGFFVAAVLYVLACERM